MSKACGSIVASRSAARTTLPFAVALVMAAVVAQALSAAPAADQKKPITLAFQDAPAADAIVQFRWLTNVPIVFQPPASDLRISLIMKDVPLDQALTALCRQMGYEWRTVGQVYVLMPAQRAPLLPAPDDVANQFLDPERQRLDAAQLMLTLTPSQMARTARGESVRYADLSQPQQVLLGGIYRRLIAAARASWISGAESLKSAPTEPPDSLAFSIRGYVWRLEQQPSAPGGQPVPTPQQPPQPAPPGAPATPPAGPPENP